MEACLVIGYDGVWSNADRLQMNSSDWMMQLRLKRVFQFEFLLWLFFKSRATMEHFGRADMRLVVASWSRKSPNLQINTLLFSAWIQEKKNIKIFFC